MGAIPAAMLTMAGTYMEGVAQENQLIAGAQEADYGANSARNNALTINRQTESAESLQRRRSGKILSTQRAAIAQGGLGSGGSMALLAARSGRDAEMDALNIRYEGGIKEASQLENERLLRWKSGQMRSAAKLAKATTFLKTAASGYGALSQSGALSSASMAGGV